ncbi:MAG: DUF58 domain-containing protein [Candidatus Aenigmatarchaeota archaeon]
MPKKEKSASKETGIEFKYDIKHLEIIPRSLVNSLIVGKYKSAFRGKGLEFDGYKKYEIGDEASTIDWKASLRTNELLSKQFVEERNLTMFFLVDTSMRMCSGSIEKFKNEYAAELIAALSYTVMQGGDSVGIAMFNDNVVKTVLPNIGPSQFYLITKALSNVKNYGGGSNIVSALKYLENYLELGTMLVIVSDFIGAHGNVELEKHLKIISNKYDVIAVMIRDIRDRVLPRGVGNVLIMDPYTGKEMVINPDVVGNDYEDYVREEESDLEHVFLEAKADFLSLQTDSSFMHPLLRFFKRREERFH